ncbi:hypothetical protein KI659_07620 [Litoribacter alkaliphilus]|uniref:HTH luxR-type domain-containing protein n=1 Tax=Litoribacter ruber TaxID=702568 RepID=A0AAP2G4B8_9BACT|nr:LuxR C-terminal-related transcriptional regulator [Litoribacter alkaliphilus]MBS9523881.1 hypothetical protein [Litoribacter alkaliphilus]
MKKGLDLMHKVWEKQLIDKRSPINLPNFDLKEVFSPVFASGPNYYYLVDFSDFSITTMSQGFEEAHRFSPDFIEKIDDVLELIHPDDVEFVSKAEDKAFRLIREKIGVEKIKSYKFSYNLRFKVGNGGYELFNHQSLVLSTDENHNFINAINIHTNINHLVCENSKTLSVLGIQGEPSFINLPVDNRTDLPTLFDKNLFSKREKEIIELIAEGHDSTGIAEKLFISRETVKSHRKNILKKSECKNFNAFLLKGHVEGWI